MDTGANQHYRPPFGKQQSAPAVQEPLSFRTARDQLEIDDARTKNGGAVVKKSLGMHSSAKFNLLFRHNS